MNISLCLIFSLVVWPPTIAFSQAEDPPENPPHEAPEDATVRQLTAEELGPYRPEKTPDAANVMDIVFRRTNEFREAKDLPALSRNQTLDEVAQQFAEYMAEHDRYGHTADGRQPVDRAEAGGYEYCIVAENIAFHFRTEGYGTKQLGKEAFTGWRDSPPHRKNMLRPHVTETGLGLAQSSETGVFYTVQLVGRPRSAAITFQIVNKSEQPVGYAVGEEEFTLPAQAIRTHQMCVPAKLIVTGEDAAEDEPLLETMPDDKDRFVVTGDGDEWKIERTEMPEEADGAMD